MAAVNDWNTAIQQMSLNQKQDIEHQHQIQRDLGLLPPMDRHPDVRFRGKPLATLNHEEMFEALQQAITHLKALTGHTPPFTDLKLGEKV